MRIAIITRGELPVPNVKGGGAETLVTSILDENEKDINAITVFSILDEKAMNAANKYEKTEFYFMQKNSRTIVDRIRTRLFKDFPREAPYSFSEVEKIIRTGNYDKIVIEHSPWQFPYFVKKYGEKVFLHLHNDWINEDIDKCYKKRYVEAINNSGGVIAVSEYLKKRIQTVGSVDSEKIRVLYNATDIEMFSNRISDAELENLKRDYGIEENDIVLVFSGRLCKEKGVLELIQAFQRIIRISSQVKLIIIGSVSYGETTEDDYTKKIEKEIENSGGKIVVTGFVDYNEIPKYYRLGDIQIIPSMWDEPFGLVAIEGAASGLSIISTNSGGLKEIFEDKYAKIVTRENIVDDLEKSILELLRSKEERNHYKKQSSQLIKTHPEFKYSNYYKEFINIIK